MTEVLRSPELKDGELGVGERGLATHFTADCPK